MNLLNKVYLMSKFDVSSFFMARDIKIFKLVILLTLINSKLMVIFLTLCKSKLTLTVYSSDFRQATVILLSLGKMLGCEKQSKLHPFDKKIRNHTQIGSGTIHF